MGGGGQGQRGTQKDSERPKKYTHKNLKQGKERASVGRGPSDARKIQTKSTIRTCGLSETFKVDWLKIRGVGLRV